MNMRIVKHGVTAILVLALSAAGIAEAAAQIDACYTEKTGVIYRIDPGGTLGGGLPTECIKPDKHIRFSWVDADGADHSLLTGLTEDDHLQYLPVDGSRGMTGQLGVGTPTAGAPVEILHSTVDHTLPHLLLNSANGSGQNTIQLQHDGVIHSKIRGAGGGDLLIGTHFGDELKFYTAAGAELDQDDEIKMVIGAAGNVGIGTTTPAEKLSVNGVVEATGGIKFGNGTTQTTAAGGSSSPLVGFEVVSDVRSGDIPAHGARDVFGVAICPLGKVPLIGGYEVQTGFDVSVTVLQNYPFGGLPSGWAVNVRFHNPLDEVVSGTVWVHATCVNGA